MNAHAGFFLLQQVICNEISKCYEDVNICLWTDGSLLTRSDAETACRQQDSFFLPRITSLAVQYTFTEFRSKASDLVGSDGFWLGITAVPANQFHWIDGSSFAGI